MGEKLKIKFTDFWPDFVPDDNYFVELLSRRYDIELSDQPDVLFYSCFGEQFRNYSCKRVYYTGENTRPKFHDCDYAFTFDYSDNPRNYRLPLYGLVGGEKYKPASLLRPKPTLEEYLSTEKKFCNFIYSNERATIRQEFYHKLSKYKKIDSGGKVLNNIGYRVGDKFEFMSHYKFTIAFENESYPGYTTEKIAHPMTVHSMPIYWGNPLVSRDFNSKSFINTYDFPSLDAVVERVVEADRDDKIYGEYFAQPYLPNNEYNEFISPENVLARLQHIVETPITPIAVTLKGKLRSGIRNVQVGSKRLLKGIFKK